jgi:hypothetical protein
MSRLQQLATSLALTLAVAAPAAAAQSATLVLRSGERVSGELVDMSDSGFQMRVSGSSRRIPTGDVAVIDFGGGSFPPAEVDQVTDGKHVVVLSNGQTVRGRVYDIGGATPLRISVDTDSGRRDFNSNEVRRIYLARPGGSSSVDSRTSQTPSAPLPATGGQIRVPANQRWTDTGITVRKGDRVSFNANGQVQLSTAANDNATPAGAASGRRPSGPMPNVLAGALIARVGPVAMFGIGNQTGALTMPADGRLFLGVNDDEVSDNQGEFTVDVRPESSGLNRRR